MTKYLNFFESESGFTEAVEAGQLFYPNVSYTEEDDTVHWNLGRSVETPMLRMSFSTSSPGEGVKLHRNDSYSGVTAMEIDGIPVNFVSGGTYTIASPGNHTAVYQFGSPKITPGLFRSDSGEFDTFTSAEITSAVTLIDFSAFNRCSGLTGVTIPDSVTTIGLGAFDHTGLRSVTVPDSVTTLGGYQFYHCTEMRWAIIGSGVTTILDQTFGECTSLLSVVLPDGLKAIGNEVFINCHSLRSIYIPSGVTAIGERAFIGCSGLTAIYLYPETPPSLGAAALDYTNECPIYVPSSSVETYKQAWPSYAYRIKTKHRISASVNDEDKGEVMLYQETAPEGAQVGFDVDVYDSFENQVSSVTITDGNGDAVEYTDEDYGGGTLHYQFTMPDSDVTISVVIEEKPEGQYKISTVLNDDSLGQVNLEQETASEGDHVEFHVEVFDPQQYQVNSVAVTDGNGNEVECNEDWDNHYSFDMPASDVTILVTIGDKPREKHTVTVNSTDNLVTDVAIINEETGDWDWDYEGELSFPEGEHADFAIRVPEGYLAVSAQASDCDGPVIDDVNMYRQGDSDVYECSFEMPYCDASVFITVEADTRPRYNITASVNDDSLGRVDLHQDIALEGETFDFDVKVFDPDANHVSSVTCTDGNGNEIKCWWDFDERDYSRYHINDMPASDVTISVVIEPKQ